MVVSHVVVAHWWLAITLCWPSMDKARRESTCMGRHVSAIGLLQVREARSSDDVLKADIVL